MIKWLFFDLGSTLIDETACTEYRIQETLKQPGAPSHDIFYKRMLENASCNKLPYKDTVKAFGLKNVQWPGNLEKLYPGVQNLLKVLSEKYKLGIIANQEFGTEQRLERWRIRQYFDVVIASAEAGIAKPDEEIFKMALQRAGCKPQEAFMIGDRLDNDIAPAGKLGMHTIWVKQGWFANGSPAEMRISPEKTVDNILDILKYIEKFQQNYF